MKLKVLWLLIALISSPTLSAEPEWQLWRDRAEVQVYSRPSHNGIIEIRATTRVKTTLSAFIALLHDTERLPEWMESVSKVTVINEPDRTHDIVHTKFKAPWPIVDRDMVTSSEYHQPTPCSLVLEIIDNHGALPELEDHVRIIGVTTRWTLEQRADGIALIDYRAHANVSGKLPLWVANRLSLQTAFNTFSALRLELEKESYQAQTVEGIANC